MLLRARVVSVGLRVGERVRLLRGGGRGPPLSQRQWAHHPAPR